MGLSKALLLLLAIAFLAASVRASSWAVAYSDGDYYIEAYDSDYGWFYSTYPYNYYSDGWYFFEYPWRYNYGSAYYYYDPGWYYFYPEWHYSPYSYNYYSPAYYYFDGYWNYYPSWYYYPYSYYSYWYYPTYYLAPYPYQGTVVSIEPGDSVSCEQLQVSTRSIELKQGQTTEESFYLYNDSGKSFYITSVVVSDQHEDIDLSAEWFDSAASANSTAQIIVSASADITSEPRSITAYLKISGRFSDGTTCSSSDIGTKMFKVLVRAAEQESTGSGSTSSTQSSSSFSWGSAQTVSANQWQVAEDNAFENAAVLSTVGQDYFSNAGFEGCSEIRLEAKNFYLQRGEKEEAEFIVRNNSSKDFYLDYLNVYDSDEGIIVAESNYSKIVPALGHVNVMVSAEALSGADTGTYEASFKVFGHFAEASSCSSEEIGTKKFYVFVEGKKEASCSGFELIVPDRKIIDSQGKIEVTVRNPTSQGGTINVYGEGVTVLPGLLQVQASSVATKTLYITGLSKEKTWLLYDIHLSDCALDSKATILEKEKAALEPAGTQPIQPVDVEENIGIESVVSEPKDGFYEVTVKISNNSEIPTSGEIAADIPEGWNVEGTGNIKLRGLEQRIVSLKVVPDKAFEGQRVAEISFTTKSGKSASSFISFKPVEPENKPIALAGLAEGSLLIGGIIVVAAVIVALFYLHNKNKQAYVAARQKWQIY